MGILFAIILFISVLLIPTSVGAFMYYTIQEKRIAVEIKPRSEEELIAILYNIMEREWTYRVNFHFKLKDIRMPKFEYELDILVKKIMKSLSPGLMEELRYYYNDEAIISLVSEMCQILLLDYLDKNKISSNIRS